MGLVPVIKILSTCCQRKRSPGEANLWHLQVPFDLATKSTRYRVGEGEIFWRLITRSAMGQILKSPKMILLNIRSHLLT